MRGPRLPSPADVVDIALARRVREFIEAVGVKEAMRRLRIGNETLSAARSGSMKLEARAKILEALERETLA